MSIKCKVNTIAGVIHNTFLTITNTFMSNFQKNKIYILKLLLSILIISHKNI